MRRARVIDPPVDFICMFHGDAYLPVACLLRGYSAEMGVWMTGFV